MKKIAFLLLVISQGLYSQEYSSRLIDPETNEAVPYATVLIGQNQGIISNDQGYFSFDWKQIKNPLDSIEISSMGYLTLKIPFESPLDSVIYLKESTYELAQVIIESNPLDVDEILERLIENLDKNHPDIYRESQVFYRQSQITSMKKMDFELKESTLEGFDVSFIDSVQALIPKHTAYYYEMAGTRIGNFKTGKLSISKAAELYDKEKDLSFDGIGEKMEDIFTSNVKSNSYLKIKSGIFSTKVQLDSILDSNKEMEEAVEEVKEKEGFYQFSYFEGSINRLFDDLFYREDSELDIIEKESRYRWELEGYELIQNEAVYKINFTPKGGRDFQGIIYVNMDDFGVMRLDFHNVKNISSFNLLGLSYQENQYSGKVIFTHEDGIYYPQFMELIEGDSFGVKRPLKIIEKNKYVKGRRKQNEIYFKMNIKVDSQTKHELLILSSKASSEAAYKALERNKDFEATYLSKFDPEFWEEYLIIEPNETIQSFSIEQ
ncbi:MAG: carboxypeptidase-like regulatory domain-containing protein [Flavobacteriaceae bacterium]